ncbi:E2 domain-containing protein [Agrobacterium rosae]|uniref:E2 domain-containing protein n=1 Tax=Agrobacterium rosae TaxID=1972867 RepID=UPI000CD94942|nr:E2 domain-containing protein [Agrobacterium rosae]POO57215.1 hypothetical protein CTT39_00385 [Agrobacterium rosae]
MSLNHLIGEVPDWFKVNSVTATEILGTTSLRIENAVGVIALDLRVHEIDGSIAVQEQVPGTRFPKTCHERHLQSDEHFCIGLDAGEGICSSDHAVVWWGLLKHFLELQRVAERTRRWPPRQEMAHGHAGPHQLAAMNAAAELGIGDQYMRMLDGERSWLADSTLKVTPRGRLAHGWMACPVGCRKNGRPITRSSCPRQPTVIQLVTEERLRRAKAAAFNANAKAWGDTCCGTMLNCPLA